MPTGAGKTRTAMHIVCRLLAEAPEDATIVWLAATEELCSQASDEFQSAWKHLGNRDAIVCKLWGTHGDTVTDEATTIIVSSLKLLNSRITKYPETLAHLSPHLVLTVFDEAHQAVAPTYKNVTEFLCAPGTPLLGLSATPGRTAAFAEQDLSLAELFNYNLVSMSTPGYPNPIDYLIAHGYSAQISFSETKYDGDSQSTADLDGSDDYGLDYLVELGQDENRNRLIYKDLTFALNKHKRVIVFCPSVSSVRHIAKLAQDARQVALPVIGTTESSERHSYIQRYLSDDPTPIAILNYGVLTAGFDAPATSCAIIARPTKSLVLYSQMVGRAARGPKVGGNLHSDVYTVVDTAAPGFATMQQAFNHWNPLWDME